MKKLRFKQFLRERNEFSKTGDETLLSVSEYYGVKPRAEAFASEEYESRAATLEGYRIVKKSDLVMNYMLAWKGAYGISEYDGIVSPAYSIFTIDKNVADVRYLHHRVRSDDMKAYFRSRSKGIIESRLRLYPDSLLASFVDLPDLHTQREIADFLDRETARIDLLIEKKQKLVALLGEKWESTVENAISTGGKRTKLGHHIDILSGYAFPSSDFSTDPEDIPLLRGANVAPSAIRWDDTVYWSRERLSEVSRFLLSAGDVVLGMDRPWIASGIRVAEMTEQDVPALLLQRVCRIKPRMTLDQQFMKLLLTSRQFLSYFEPIMTGVSVPHISPDQVSSFRFEHVEREEQVRRATMAGRERERIIRIQKSSDKSMDRLKEYRSALITAAVTGQIDVITYAKSGATDRKLDAIQEEMGA